VKKTSLAAWRMAIKTEASQRDYFILTEVFNVPVKITNPWLTLQKSLPEA
jgi:hypothetical protein